MLTSISGFPELLPRDQIIFNQIVDTIRYQFELHGFTPFDSPSVEKTSVLLSKGNDSEIYGIHRLADSDGKKDLGLRFDLTVPLARYVAQRCGQLTFPYRRYQIGQVWRGERPQAGRYRQFCQGDIDIIGDGDLSLSHDVEMVLIIHRIFRAIGVGNIIIRMNNCSILKGLLLLLGVAEDNLARVMRVIDKADKISANQLKISLMQEGMTEDNAEELMIILTITRKGEQIFHPTILDELLEKFDPRNGQIHAGLEQGEQATYGYRILESGILELQEVVKLATELGLPDNIIAINLSLARGLSYYTGTLYEVQLREYPEIGSVCGGGRYENLVANFTNRKLPGVGISIGITRLVAKLLEVGILQGKTSTIAQVLVTNQNTKLTSYYMIIGDTLRAGGINTEVYLQDKPLGHQMKYADKKGFKIAMIADESEFTDGNVIVRDLRNGQQECTKVESALHIVKQML